MTASDLPKPSLKVLDGFDTDDESPEVKVVVELLCATCGEPWESFAGLMSAPKRPSPLIVSPDEVDDSNVRVRNDINRRTIR